MPDITTQDYAVARMVANKVFWGLAAKKVSWDDLYGVALLKLSRLNSNGTLKNWQQIQDLNPEGTVRYGSVNKYLTLAVTDFAIKELNEQKFAPSSFNDDL